MRLRPSGEPGWAVITEVISPEQVRAAVRRPFASTAATADWRLGAWSAERGYPSAVTFFEQRTAWANTRAQPQSFWMSQSGDLGSSAARKFDIEAWIPTQGKYREVTSTSNTTEYQARRLAIRMREEGKVRPLATLNGTLVAVPRTIVAILENHQQADGSVVVPEALRPFLGGLAVIEPVAK